MEQNQTNFEHWAIVEVMGHQTFPGFVTSQAFGSAVLFRVEVPALPERQEVLESNRWINGDHFTAGTTIVHTSSDGFTKLIGAASIYAITPCTEEVVMAAVARMYPPKLRPLGLPFPAPLHIGSGLFRPMEDEHIEDEPAGSDFESEDLTQ